MIPIIWTFRTRWLKSSVCANFFVCLNEQWKDYWFSSRFNYLYGIWKIIILIIGNFNASKIITLTYNQTHGCYWHFLFFPESLFTDCQKEVSFHWNKFTPLSSLERLCSHWQERAPQQRVFVLRTRNIPSLLLLTSGGFELNGLFIILVSLLFLRDGETKNWCINYRYVLTTDVWQ